MHLYEFIDGNVCVFVSDSNIHTCICVCVCVSVGMCQIVLGVVYVVLDLI